MNIVLSVITEVALLEATALGRNDELAEMQNRMSAEHRRANREAIDMATPFSGHCKNIGLHFTKSIDEMSSD